MTYQNAIAKHGKIHHNGVDIAIMQQPFPSADASQVIGESEWFEAHGMDADGNGYKITWDVTDFDADGEAACDWEAFEVKATGMSVYADTTEAAR